MGNESHGTKAKRLDRFMAWLISAGGVLIIAAVLGIMVFITIEALPLFRGAKTRELTPSAVPACDVVFLDDSGKYAATFDRLEGFKRGPLEQPDAIVSDSGSQPPLPWRSVFFVNARGRVAVQGSDNRVYAGELRWGGGDQASDAHVEWTGPFYTSASDNLIATKLVRGGGLGNRQFMKIAALGAGSIRVGRAAAESAIEWSEWSLPPNVTPVTAEWSENGSTLFVGTREGELIAYEPDRELLRSEFGEPVTALGFALGYNSLLVGGGGGKLAAYQILRRDGNAELQRFHDFAPIGGSVRGFMESLRDKRFLVWSESDAAIYHLTTEKLLTRLSAEIQGAVALSPRGDNILATGQPSARRWHVQVFHPEVSWSLFWSKIHYEGYTGPEYVWQSSGASDDIEPKLSLVPLLFGTLKGTLYAMLFALPIAVLAALYTSQFASPKFRETIKPTVEIMAALPSVVLGFIAGLVLAPLLEQWMIALLAIVPIAVIILILLMFAWSKIPKPFRDKFGSGKEALWLIPVLFMALLFSVWTAPWLERVFFGGDYRNWLYQGHSIVYDQRNSIVVGFAMGFAVIPIIFSISEDAFTAVPKSLASASLACGASQWQTAWRVILPTASPGVFSAVMVGLGRAVGETMIVLMATGNTPLMDWGPFNGMRTLSANIAVEIPEAPHQGTLYRVLFFTALLLFALTFILNTAAELVRQSLRKRYESM
ncbi:MAG: ABC transporter permease subunit [Holophagales bacterium]|jgi:phosphate transport system permease protein|nr:ABC transporter permease subunit [Holophagales bacterium]